MNGVVIMVKTFFAVLAATSRAVSFMTRSVASAAAPRKLQVTGQKMRFVRADMAPDQRTACAFGGGGSPRLPLSGSSTGWAFGGTGIAFSTLTESGATVTLT